MVYKRVDLENNGKSVNKLKVGLYQNSIHLNTENNRLKDLIP